MNNNDLKTPRELFQKATKGLKNIDKKPLTRANVRYMFASIALTGLVMWLFGINVWTILLGLFFQSIYFFGQKVTTVMFRFSLAGVVVILVSGLLYNVFIEKTGLSDDMVSYQKDKILKTGVDLENPAADLEARIKGLIRDSASKALAQNFNDVDGLFKSTESIKIMEDRLYNSLHNKKSPASAPAVNKNSGQQNNQQPRVIDIAQFKKQVGDTAYYTFTLKDNESTSEINLVDQNGQFYAYNLIRSNEVAVNANGQRQVWVRGRSHNFWEPRFNFEAITGKTPVTISLKIFPAAKV
jgi:hypothetical protein